MVWVVVVVVVVVLMMMIVVVEGETEDDGTSRVTGLVSRGAGGRVGKR
jgi:uncharacterized membrane protein